MKPPNPTNQSSTSNKPMTVTPTSIHTYNGTQYLTGCGKPDLTHNPLADRITSTHGTLQHYRKAAPDLVDGLEEHLNNYRNLSDHWEYQETLKHYMLTPTRIPDTIITNFTNVLTQPQQHHLTHDSILMLRFHNIKQFLKTPMIQVDVLTETQGEEKLLSQAEHRINNHFDHPMFDTPHTFIYTTNTDVETIAPFTLTYLPKLSTRNSFIQTYDIIRPHGYYVFTPTHTQKE
jgi:hypothetical protein